MKLRNIIILCLIILVIIICSLLFFSRRNSGTNAVDDGMVTDENSSIEVNIINRSKENIEKLYIVKEVSEEEEKNLLGDDVVLDEDSMCAVSIEGYDSESKWVSYAEISGKVVSANGELTSQDLYDGATLELFYDGESIQFVTIERDEDTESVSNEDEEETSDSEENTEDEESQSEEVQAENANANDTLESTNE